MNDTIDSCKCACHENRPPMNTDGLAHDRVCCDEMNGQLEWCEVKRLIAKAVVEARLIDMKYLLGLKTDDINVVAKEIQNLIAELQSTQPSNKSKE